MTLPIFDNRPYFDDYNEDDKFLRILFRPGYAVQARELTQLQTILQKQVERFGNHIFENGSMVIPGDTKINGNNDYAKLQGSLSNSSDDVYIGAKITDGGGVDGTINHIERAEGTEPDTVFFQYNTGGSFSQNQSLTITYSDGSGTTEVVTTEDSGSAIGKGTTVSVSRGVYYLNGQFVIVKQQTITIDKYNPIDSLPGEQSIGLLTTTDIVTPEEDSSLLDNAQGSTNETAPGAHRYSLDPVLIRKQDVNDLAEYNEIARIVDGEAAREVRESEYSVLGENLAKRTFAESGNYTVKNFSLNADEHPTDSSKLLIELDPGRAFVRGFDIETTATTRLDLDKARTTDSANNVLVPLELGAYIHLKGVHGLTSNFVEVGLYQESTINYTSDQPDEPPTKIGTADTRAVIYDPTESGAAGETVVRVFLYNFSFTGSYSVADIGSVWTNTGSLRFAGEVYSESIDSSSNTVLQEPSKNIALYDVPYSEVNNITNNEFDYLKEFSSVVSGTDVTITAAVSSEQFRSAASDFIITVTNVVSGSTATSVLGDTGIPDSVSLSPDNKTATLDLSSFNVNTDDEIKVIATIFKSPGTVKSKTPVVDSTISVLSTDNQTNISLGKSDVYNLKSIVATNDNSKDYTDRYTFDDGQRDSFYDIASLTLKPGLSEPGVDLTITFDYFSHGAGDFFAVQSYNAIAYEDIPAYTSIDGTEYKLANVIDFRPKVNDSGVYDNNPIQFVPNTEAALDFEYYLPRIDKVVLNKNGNFKIVKGSPSLEPKEPADRDDSMTLYQIGVPAYTFDHEDLDISKVEHRRYRMKDIANLEQRIEDIEYYTSLNLLEQEAVNKQFTNKFKSGILVDQFTGHQVGRADKETYRCSVDLENNELRPGNSTKSIQLEEDDASSTHYQKTGDVITLPYTETSVISQTFATRVERLNPFLKFTWEGDATLSPSSDSWVSTRRAPDTTLDNGTRLTQAFRNRRNSLGTVWGSWRTFWRSEPHTVISNRRRGFGTVRRTERRLNRERRIGTQTRRVERTELEFIGDRVINRSAVPFIRSRKVDFTAKGLKPNTILTPYFADTDVSAHVSPNPLQTDAVGSVSGTFTIPNTNSTRFKTGNREFLLVDDKDVPSTRASTTYNATGILETRSRTFLATRVIDIETRRVSQRRSFFTDPLAQSFAIELENGAFITSLDIYFGPDANNNSFPVTLEIRNMENGLPGNEIVPFGKKTLDANQISGSNDSSVATNFQFDSPIYLEENTEYCFVLKTDSDALTVWISQLGEEDVLTGQRISRQPYLGSLFKSQNDKTWTPAQMQDIKFVLNRANFDNNTNGEVVFENVTAANDQGTEADPYITELPFNPFAFTNGSNIIRVEHPDHSFVKGDTVRFASPSSSALAGIPEGEIFGVNLTVADDGVNDIGFDHYWVQVTTNANDSAELGGSDVTATQNVGFSTLNLVTDQLNIEGSAVDWEFKGTAKNGKVQDSVYYSIVANEDSHLGFPRVAQASGDDTVLVRGTLSSDASNISPYIDTQRVAILATENRVNNKEDANSVASSDEAAARYITNVVELDNAADEISIFFDANRPPNTNIDVYYKVQQSGASTSFEDEVWTKATLNSAVAVNEDREEFDEYEYSVSAGFDFNVFSVKVVMRSPNEAKVPRIKDLRVIAVKG